MKMAQHSRPHLEGPPLYEELGFGRMDLSIRKILFFTTRASNFVSRPGPVNSGREQPSGLAYNIEVHDPNP